jgi:hypothetical protein
MEHHGIVVTGGGGGGCLEKHCRRFLFAPANPTRANVGLIPGLRCETLHGPDFIMGNSRKCIAMGCSNLHFLAPTVRAIEMKLCEPDSSYGQPVSRLCCAAAFLSNAGITASDACVLWPGDPCVRNWEESGAASQNKDYADVPQGRIRGGGGADGLQVR